MNLLARGARRFTLLASLLLITAAPVAVEVAAAQPGTPWLYRGSDVPQDREWNFGELRNGVRYAVRKNGVPPGQVSIRIVIDAGSLHETDSERGYAHLIEHLSFRESKYLGPAEAIPAWQRLGATFGSDTNAETSPTQTVYKLDLPNATPQALEESFKLLSGMMTAPVLSEHNVRTEVPIVLAEMRERAGAQMRVLDATQATFYAGQPLAQRMPIGTVETLQGASAASVQAFHKRWYRPQNAVVVVVGDADPAELTRLVTTYFGGWKVAGKRTPPPSFGDPVAPAGTDPARPVGETQALVEPDLPRVVNYGILRPWRKVNDTIVYNQGLMIDSLAQAIINRRLEARARGGGSFLTAQVNQEDVSRSVDGTFVTVTPLGDDWQAAVKDVRAVIADALATAPTQEEIDREVAEMEIAFQVPVEQRPLLQGAKLADDLVTAFDIRETIASPETVLDIFRMSKPLYTPQAVLEHTRTLFTGTVERGLLITPRPGPGGIAAERAALARALLVEVKPDASARLSTAPIRFEDLPPIGKPGEVTSLKPTSLEGIEQLEFANGVKVLLWPTTDEPGRVAVKVRFGAGYRAFSGADAVYATLGEMALVGAGVGALGQEELDRISTGRRMGFDFAIEDAAFEFSASTRPADLADQLYLFAAKFAMPRWDANPVIRAKAAARMQYDTSVISPQGILQRDLKYLQRDRDPRYRSPSPREIEAATPERFKAVWSEALATGPIEVQIYGDFDRKAAIAQLEKTFGALKPRAPLPAWMQKPPASYAPPADRPVVLFHRGDANQAAAVLTWPTGGGAQGIRDSRQLQILTQVFANRLMDAMREKLGESYAPQVASNWPVDLQSGGTITAMAVLQPEAVSTFFTTAREIAADLVASPPSQDELARVTEPLRQQVTRAATGSAFFMWQLEGATQDPSRFGTIRSILADYARATPADMQALAARYLQPGKSWRLAVLPQGQALREGAPPPAPSMRPPHSPTPATPPAATADRPRPALR